MNLVYQDFMENFDTALAKHDGLGRRIGAEFKFPLVQMDGKAVPYETVEALWRFLEEDLGWKPEIDSVSGKVVGARTPGEYNETVASCETGYCKVEFSFAHVGCLQDLEKMVKDLRKSLKPFCERENVVLLGYGIHPGTPPGRDLLMKKSRAGVWDKLYHSNRHIPPADGHDLHLFTVNAASHCHLSVSKEEAIPLVNTLNGFSGAQIALTADSSVWRGAVDPHLLCVSERFWDWWMPEKNRIGVPDKAFKNLEDYVEEIASMKPVFVKRNGIPYILEKYETFREYYETGRAQGIDPEGREVSFVPDRQDLDLHNTCYWFNARISSYYTVENRVNDQQHPDEVMGIPALTLGLAESLKEAREELAAWDWDVLKEARWVACERGLAGSTNGLKLYDLASRMLDLAERGLKKRDKGEEKYLSHLKERLRTRQSPAEDAAECFSMDGMTGLLEARAI